MNLKTHILRGPNFRAEKMKPFHLKDKSAQQVLLSQQGSPNIQPSGRDPRPSDLEHISRQDM
ncbi:MAG: hypothetical protein CMG46_00665 [Candidatus Marinimicrobia bacterium]|nr:hypothetical protein [Candidatus Neomarinimicrobiota bacterium]